MDHFQTWHGHSLIGDIGRMRLWGFCLIKYAHNGQFNEPVSFGIPELIFQTKVTKFGTNSNTLYCMSHRNSPICFCASGDIWVLIEYKGGIVTT